MRNALHHLLNGSALAALLLVVAPVAIAGTTHFYFAPTATDFGGGATEAYVPVAFDAPTRLSGSGLADASLAELKKKVAEVGAIEVSYAGSSATVAVAKDKTSDANVTDRALGAVFHTLLYAGFEQVSLDGKRLSPMAFSRGAFAATVPMTSALPPNRVGGFVVVGNSAMPAADFYAKVAKGDRSLQSAAKKVLDKGHPSAKVALLKQLSALGFKDPDEVVLPRLTDADPGVRLAAIERLKGRSGGAVVRGLESVVAKDADGNVKLAAVRLLVAAGKSEYKQYLLVDKLKSTNAAEVVDAIKGIVANKDKNFAGPIGELATHTNAQVRSAALDGVVGLGAWPVLSGWLGNDAIDAGSKQNAARALADKSSGADQANGLSWLVSSGPEDQALFAAGFITDKKVAGTTAALGKATARSEKTVRLAAAKALAALRDSQGLEALAGAVQKATDADEKKALTAAALEVVSAQPLDQVIKISESPDATISSLAIKSLAAFSKDKPNPKAVAVLKRGLTSTNADVRRSAAFALARIPDAGIAAEMTKLKGDKDALIRAEVARSLVHATDGGADNILKGYLDDRSGEVKVAALQGVKARKVAGALDKVKWLVTHRKIEVRRAAIDAMNTIAKPADAGLFDIYAKALIDTDSELRVHAIDGLAPYGDGRAAAAIGGALADDRADASVKLRALGALKSMKPDDAVEHLVRGLFDPDKAIKLATLDALDVMASDKAERPLQEFILGETDKETKAKAEAVLSKL